MAKTKRFRTKPRLWIWSKSNTQPATDHISRTLCVCVLNGAIYCDHKIWKTISAQHQPHIAAYIIIFSVCKCGVLDGKYVAHFAVSLYIDALGFIIHNNSPQRALACALPFRTISGISFWHNKCVLAEWWILLKRINRGLMHSYLHWWWKAISAIC